MWRLCGIFCAVLAIQIVPVSAACDQGDTLFGFLGVFTTCQLSALGTDYSSIYTTSLLVNVLSNVPGLPQEYLDGIIESSPLSDGDSLGIAACGAGIDAIRDCMAFEYEDCNATLLATVDAKVDSYRERLCEESDGVWGWSDLTQEYFLFIGATYLQLSASDICINEVFANDLSECLAEGLTSDIATFVYTATVYNEEAFTSISRAYESYFKCLYRQADLSGCSGDITDGILAYTVMLGIPAGIEFGLKEFDLMRSVSEYPTGPDRVTLTVFGDPHYIVYYPYTKTVSFVTCSSVGTRTLLSTAYVLITGENTAVDGWTGNGSAPSYMTEVTITLLDTSGSTFATYTYNGIGSLPTVFDGAGADVNGGVAGGNTNAGTVYSSNGMIRIRSNNGALMISLMQFGDTLAMKVRVEKSMLTKAIGDLVNPCPGDHLDLAAEAARRKRAVDVCVEIGLNGTELLACQFDSVFISDSVLNSTYTGLTDMDAAVEEADDDIIMTTTTTEAPSAGAVCLPHVLTTLALWLGVRAML